MDTRTLCNDISEFVDNFPFAGQIRGKTFLISGASGLIGSIFIKCLLALKRKAGVDLNIIAIGRDKEKIGMIFGDSLGEIRWIIQDISEPIAEPLPAIDFIIHTASPTASKFIVGHPVETMTSIYKGTDEMLKLAMQKKIESMVVLSSLETYGIFTDECDIFEDMDGSVNPIDVRSAYPIGKKASECLCHAYYSEYCVPVKIARLTQVFGAGVQPADNRVFAQFARSIINNNDIVLHTSGESAKPYCYTIDAVSALFYLLLKGRNGEAYNVANPDSYISVRDMARMLVDNFAPNLKVVVEPRDDMGYAPSTKLKLNTRKIESTGWRPIFGLKEMFERLISHIKEA